MVCTDLLHLARLHVLNPPSVPSPPFSRSSLSRRGMIRSCGAVCHRAALCASVARASKPNMFDAAKGSGFRAWRTREAPTRHKSVLVVMSSTSQNVSVDSASHNTTRLPHQGLLLFETPICTNTSMQSFDSEPLRKGHASTSHCFALLRWLFFASLKRRRHPRSWQRTMQRTQPAYRRRHFKPALCLKANHSSCTRNRAVLEKLE